MGNLKASYKIITVVNIQIVFQNLFIYILHGIIYSYLFLKVYLIVEKFKFKSILSEIPFRKHCFLLYEY